MGTVSRGAAVGGTVFAAALMIMNGLWSLLAGISAIARDRVFVATPDYLYKIGLSGWGWIHLLLGLLIAAAGVCLLMRQAWARVVAIVLAMLSAVAQFLFLPYYPWWSILVIAIDIFVVWALVTEDSEIAGARGSTNQETRLGSPEPQADMEERPTG